MNSSIKIFLLLFLICDSYFSQNLRNHLIAHYEFNGNANDLSRNGNDGIVNGPIQTYGRLNIPNTAYYFDGIDDYIQVQDNESFQIADNKVTIAVWAKVKYPADKFFLYKGSNQFNREYELGLRIDSLASLGINNLGGWASDQYGVASKTIIQSDTWYHIVGSWDGTTQKIYINGVLENTSEVPVVIGDYNSDLFIGTYGGKIEDYALNGTIDDIMIYNTALTNEEVYQLYNPSIMADFSSDTTLGIVPLTTHFFDQSVITDSTVKILTWEWDFDNNGQIDSWDKNPEWTYLIPGIYTVKLTVTDSVSQYTAIKENYITALSENPHILTVEDVPNDQGKWVKLKFLKSIYDTDSLILMKTASTELYTVEINEGSGWTASTSTVAYGKTIYTILVATTNDSTNISSGMTQFRVVGGMEEGNFSSNIIVGYSIDNLKPSVPNYISASWTANNNIELDWAKVTDTDFNYYNVYRNSENLFNEFSQPIFKTTSTRFIDNQIDSGATYYYCVKAVDFSGNESQFSEITQIILVSIQEKQNDIPITFSLFQNYPNPFNPITTIIYSIPEFSKVVLRIYDSLGKEVSTLVNNNQNSGKYEIDFDASSLSSGIYYYTLYANNYFQSRKLIVLK